MFHVSFISIVLTTYLIFSLIVKCITEAECMHLTTAKCASWAQRVEQWAIARIDCVTLKSCYVLLMSDERKITTFLCSLYFTRLFTLIILCHKVKRSTAVFQRTNRLGMTLIFRLSDIKDPNNNLIFRTVHYNAESRSRANVLYNSLRVDHEPRSVIRELSVNDTTLTM